MKEVVEQLKAIVANTTKLIADRKAELVQTQTQLTTAIAENEQLKANDASLASELKGLLEALSSAVSNG
jgi:septal ring factor EnvC (AmiA/AmiB activator)